jgi:hypothetical protein
MEVFFGPHCSTGVWGLKPPCSLPLSHSQGYGKNNNDSSYYGSMIICAITLDFKNLEDTLRNLRFVKAVRQFGITH